MNLSMMEDMKKADRKRKRFAARLKSSKGILCTDEPGPNIVLCNVGQATGMEKDIINTLVQSLLMEIPLPKYIAEKGETHAFLVFYSTESATLFFNTYNGKVINNSDTVLYMNFVEEVPNTDIVCAWDMPKGLTLLNNFISMEEEDKLINVFDWTTNIESSLKNRQVRHYGYEFRYGTNDVDLNNPLTDKIPQECDMLWRRMTECGYDLGIPEQLTVNKYSPGQGIPSHVDKHSPFGDTILSLSLGSDVVMDWRHHTGIFVPILVPCRSLLIMQDEARYDWQHGIQPRTWDPIIKLDTQRNVRVVTSDSFTRGTRISLTFRWTRRGPCQCLYKTLCDSASTISPDDLEQELAANLEELHVHQVYEKIAGHFSSTRHKPWPKVVQFMQSVRPASVVLDLGSGNGKNILSRHDIIQIAGERSAGLLAECKTHIRGVSAADCLQLDLLYTPLADECADVVICIAVIHHFSSKARRLQAVSTIYRLLRLEGRSLITVWAKDQTKSNYLCKNKQNEAPTRAEVHTAAGVSLPVHENRTQFQHKDLLVPWKLRRVNDNKLSNEPETTLLRYYHVFEDSELDELCREAGFTIEDSFYEEGNWCVVCKKK